MSCKLMTSSHSDIICRWHHIPQRTSLFSDITTKWCHNLYNRM